WHIVSAAGRVHVGAAVEEQRDHLTTAADDCQLQRCQATAVSAVDDRGVSIEAGANRVDVTEIRRAMNRVVRLLRDDTPALIACALEHSDDLLVAALSGHLDQAAIV